MRRRPELVCTDGDPWCAEGAVASYGETLDVDVHVVAGRRAPAVEDGYGPWPDVERWALTGRRVHLAGPPALVAP